jgi:Arc/MetJ-type ribon-helix-helix transcriptional regulator
MDSCQAAAMSSRGQVTGGRPGSMSYLWMCVQANTGKPNDPPPPADTEKITVNLGYVDLGHVDLMVQEGFYSNRTDFIRTAIRNQLERHNDVVKKSVVRQQLDIGLHRYSREDLEAVRAANETQVLGLAIIADDVSPELARDTIASVHVLGALHASAEVKAALKDRIH